MIFMISGGLSLRNAHLLPAIAIGVIYCGIGVSLEGTRVLFLQKFMIALKINNKESWQKYRELG